jgi:solute carrier family 35 protein E3
MLLQISKVATTPATLFIEALVYRKPISHRVLASVLLLMVGVGLSTVSDPQVVTNPLGMLVAALNVIGTAINSVWTGSLQKKHHADGNQLLHAVAPYAVVLLTAMVPLVEPGAVQLLTSRSPVELLGYIAAARVTLWIALGSVLGLVVTLSAYLMIGATSGTTYSVVGHLKTVAVVGCGVLLFGDSFQLRKMLGLALTMGGMGWYTYIVVQQQQHPQQQREEGQEQQQKEEEEQEEQQAHKPL